MVRDGDPLRDTRVRGGRPDPDVGAYGTEVSNLIQRVRTWDRAEGVIRTFAAAECGFGYRDSRFKREKGRHLVLRVDFQLPLGEMGQPVRYPELARALGVEVGQRAPAARVRETVLAIRRRKGMVLDENDHDTWSAGSFFTNPVLTPEQAVSLPAEASPFPGREGIKTSAAWLIQHAGFPAGHGTGPARLSTRHVLGAHPTAGTPPPPTSSPSPARSATACGNVSASPWSPR